jgi:hypothetical protein
VRGGRAAREPVPTTMTVYFRLFAGFTTSSRSGALSHFCSIGPDGILERSSIDVRCSKRFEACVRYRTIPASTAIGTIEKPR